jgi:parallel beta-helix repeat protein
MMDRGKIRRGLLSFVAVRSAVFIFVGNNALSAGIPAAPHISPPCTSVTNYYVSKTGNDLNNGSAGSPWLTIQHAVNALGAGAHGGVCVNVGDGTYVEAVHASGVSGSADTPTGYLVFRSQNLHGATVQMPASLAAGRHACFQFDQSSYVVVDGFILVGQPATNSIEKGFSATRSSPTASHSHHFKVLNNIIHDHGGPGVGLQYTDYVDVEGNIIYDNCHTSPYEESGITDWHPAAFDQNPGFHNVIANNVVFDNAEVNNGRKKHTDGNGIVMDDFHDSQKYGPSYGPYTCESLVANNLVFGNGGGGIHIFLSDHVTVRNNTAFDNYRDPLNPATWRGDINAIWAGHCTFINNISVANPAANTNNTAYTDAGSDGSNAGNLWKNDLSFNGTPGERSILISGSSSTIAVTNGNILGSDPLFNDPANHDFTLQTGSPAINTGTGAYSLPAIDLGGNASATGGVSLGAYEFAPAPER